MNNEDKWGDHGLYYGGLIMLDLVLPLFLEPTYSNAGSALMCCAFWAQKI